jgi:hypothetical protein
MATRLLIHQTADGDYELPSLGSDTLFVDDNGEIVSIVIDNDTKGWTDDNDITPVLTLAETMQSNRSHTCTHVMDYHKTSDRDFFTHVNQNGKWTDEAFKTDDAHYFADGGSNETGSSMVGHARTDQWHRISDSSFWKPGDKHTLFGTESIRPRDIEQGEIGNCWFLTSITALAEYEGRVESLFLNNELSKTGTYGVNMYALGVPITIMVDDYLPLRSWGSGVNTRYARVSNDGAIWGPIIEKAFAKFHGNYARIVGGDPVSGVSTLNGSPYERFWTDEESADSIWNIIWEHDQDDKKSLM